jgi:hypothetical protein
MPQHGMDALGRRISNNNSVKLRALRGESSFFLIVHIRLFSVSKVLNFPGKRTNAGALRGRRPRKGGTAQRSAP